MRRLVSLLPRGDGLYSKEGRESLARSGETYTARKSVLR